jgi:hypothetical protein
MGRREKDQHSISASTPTALWMMAHGIDDYWMPLFPRRRGELLKILEGGQPLPAYEGE